MKFTRKDIKKIRGVFDEKLKTYDIYKPQAVYWNNEFTQYTRYKILTQIGDLNGKKILDVGCGLGDFSFYLRSKFRDILYKGIDITSKMIENAKIKYPLEDFIFAEIDDLGKEKFDYSFAAGVFSLKIPNYKQKYFQVIKSMYEISKIGVAFNMLNINGHPNDETFASYDPHDIEKTCKKFAARTKLILGYLPQDFTIFLYHSTKD